MRTVQWSSCTHSSDRRADQEERVAQRQSRQKGRRSRRALRRFDRHRCAHPLAPPHLRVPWRPDDTAAAFCQGTRATVSAFLRSSSLLIYPTSRPSPPPSHVRPKQRATCYGPRSGINLHRPQVVLRLSPAPQHQHPNEREQTGKNKQASSRRCWNHYAIRADIVYADEAGFALGRVHARTTFRDWGCG